MFPRNRKAQLLPRVPLSLVRLSEEVETVMVLSVQPPVLRIHDPESVLRISNELLLVMDQPLSEVAPVTTQLETCNDDCTIPPPDRERDARRVPCRFRLLD